MHIKVVDSRSGQPIVTGEICTLGYWSPFFDGTKRKQGWHDKAGNDFVVLSSTH